MLLSLSFVLRTRVCALGTPSESARPTARRLIGGTVLALAAARVCVTGLKYISDIGLASRITKSPLIICTVWCIALIALLALASVKTVWPCVYLLPFEMFSCTTITITYRSSGVYVD